MTKKEFKIGYGGVREWGRVQVFEGIEFIPRILHYPAEVRRQIPIRDFTPRWKLELMNGTIIESLEVAYIRRSVLECLNTQMGFTLFYYGASGHENRQLFMARRFN